MNEATKLVEAAEWLANEAEHWSDSEYYEQMAHRLQRYPVDEKDEYVYRRVYNIGGFEGVLDVVFGKDSRITEDGMEGLHEAAKEDVIRFIGDRNESGWSRAASFEKALSDAPGWFRRRIAEHELEYVPQSSIDEETEEYRNKLEEVLEE